MSKKDDSPVLTVEHIRAYTKRLNDEAASPTPVVEMPAEPEYNIWIRATRARLENCEQGYAKHLKIIYGDEVVDRAIAAENDDAKDGC